jgi:hypothetical protein
MGQEYLLRAAWSFAPCPPPPFPSSPRIDIHRRAMRTPVIHSQTLDINPDSPPSPPHRSIIPLT